MKPSQSAEKVDNPLELYKKYVLKPLDAPDISLQLSEEKFEHIVQTNGIWLMGLTGTVVSSPDIYSDWFEKRRPFIRLLSEQHILSSKTHTYVSMFQYNVPSNVVQVIASYVEQIRIRNQVRMLLNFDQEVFAAMKPYVIPEEEEDEEEQKQEKR
eukprot:807684_1